MIEADTIRESDSSYLSNVLIARKKDYMILGRPAK